MSTPGVPMNMEQWQLQMRAQKEEERKKKTETAEMLQNYRGGVREEDLMLKALREEDRKKRQDSERLLHSYQNNEVEIKQRAARNDPNSPYPPVTPKQGENPSDAISPGVVSALAANFAGHDLEEMSPPKSYSNESSAGVSVLDEDSSLLVQGDMEHSYSPELEEKKADMPDSKPMTVRHPEDEPLHDHPTIVRLDVHFTFGLVTESSQPVLDGYMMAVEDVVQQLLRDKPQVAEHLKYNPSFGPFVQGIAWDDTFVDPSRRSNVQRALVTASVPVFMTNGISIHAAREEVIGALRQSIQSGRFLQVAHSSGYISYE